MKIIRSFFVGLMLIGFIANAQDKYKPVIDGPYRVLFHPAKYGDAINDHTVFQDKDSNWRVIGILSSGPNLLVTHSFVHGVGPSLDKEMAELPPLFERYPDHDLKYAPHVIVDNCGYHLFTGPGKIRHYTSPDGISWTFKDYVIKSDWGNLRDTMVIKIAEKQWLMYATDRENSITVFESNDLDHWTRKGTAFKAIKPATVYPKLIDISSCESPFVIFYQGYYYLSVCLTTTRNSNYSNTVIFRSRDPYNFGVYAASGKGQTADYVTTLSAHAAEYIRDKDGNWFITSCGWRQFRTPGGAAKGALNIAPLKWEKDSSH